MKKMEIVPTNQILKEAGNIVLSQGLEISQGTQDKRNIIINQVQLNNVVLNIFNNCVILDPMTATSLDDVIDTAKKKTIERLMELERGNVRAVSRRLDSSYERIMRAIKNLGIDRDKHREFGHCGVPRKQIEERKANGG